METIMSSSSKKGLASSWPADLVHAEDRADRMFRDLVRDFFAGNAFAERFSGMSVNPLRLEEFTKDGVYVIRAEFPGMDPDKDIEITLADGALTLRAHREERSEQGRPDGYHSEFRYGSFQRTVALPAGATDKDVKATYKDGILEVRIPVEASAPQQTRIPVEQS
jgi:HSP20 family protein